MLFLIAWNRIPIYQINTVMATLMAIAFTALFVLMVVLKPTTLLNRLATWFALCCTALSWRTVAALLHPEWFGLRESLIASLLFAIATITTVAFGAVAWYEHVGDMLNHRRIRKDKKRGWHD